MDKECKCKQPNYNPIGRCLTCGDFQPAGTFPDTQLPAEVLKKIDSDANDYLGAKDVEFSQRSFNAYIAGATEYATKLLQEQRDRAHEVAIQKMINKEALKLTEKAQKRLQELQDELYQSKALLRKVTYRHEGGLLPDRFIYEEIKTFLDGTK